MKTALSFEYAHDEELPPPHTSDFRTPNALVEHVLQTYTDPGDAVIDIFAGYGTTLIEAERLDRIPFGLEYEPERVAYIRERLSTPTNVREGDVLDFDPSWVPTCEMCFTSPPFMEQTDDRNPFENYAGESSYDAYLDDIETAFSNLEGVIAPEGHLVVDVANMKHEGRVTPLAWDVAERISNVFHFDGEVVVSWEGDDAPDGTFGYGYDHSYMLVFTNEA
ncbi:DNA methylase N-4/N-6 domain-containing protein [Haloferax elongans ATCC BAA-1513]|uniref:Type II methyltransferase n=2 Tax=Haloferax elongans TaxID=403191 RepID=M0HS48_HALEO|nr:DNA methylase N-4/N-6 domain-containing protein [Haloferax elongans ATCC BAA-1513]